MAIETNFSFRHAHVQAPSALQTLGAVDQLGLLREFVGNMPAVKSQRRWRGTGFNLIWRPNFGQASGPTDFFLQLNLTSETLDFTDITGTGIANRGFLQPDIFLGGIAYTQAIDDSFDGSGQHFEPGVWTTVPLTTNPNEPATVGRMGTIPHGTTINLQGTAFTAAAPQFDPSSITPFGIGSPDDGMSGLVPFPEENLSTPSASRTPLNQVAQLTQAQLSNPNLFLSQEIVGQNITRTTVIQISSDSAPAGSIPDAGGGTDNIAFLQGVGTPLGGGPNAVASKVTATFWIEAIQEPSGQEVLQLQYTQRVLLDFNGLHWPHVTVGTLRIV